VSDHLAAGHGIENLVLVVATGGTVAELLGKTIDPIRFIVEGLIPEGLTLLVGKPKLGKSWLAILFALLAAAGNPVFGFRTRCHEALYIALEDGERRLQGRLQYLGAGKLPRLERFHYRTGWPTLDRGGLEELEQWMSSHPETRLIVIDTWAKIRGHLPGKDRYSEEYALLGALQTFALKHGIALVLVHHLRKEGADDWIEQTSGSQAMTGAADTILGRSASVGRWTPLCGSSPATSMNSTWPSDSMEGAGSRWATPLTTA
jgi:hypothetical protein